MEIGLVLNILKEGLKLWNNREANKYLDEAIKLEKEYHEEMQKDPSDRSDFVLDSIMLKLRILSNSFISHTKNAPGSSGQ